MTILHRLVEAARYTWAVARMNAGILIGAASVAFLLALLVGFVDGQSRMPDTRPRYTTSLRGAI